MIVHGFVPQDVRVSKQIRAAVDDGFVVDVIALREADEERVANVLGATCHRLPIRHVHGGGAAAMVKEYLGFVGLATAKAAVLGARRRYDVVQIHNPPDFLMGAALVPRVLGARIVFDVHDLASDMFQMRFGGTLAAGLADRVLRVTERIAARLADVVLTVHEPYRRELIGRGVAPTKIVVVMNTLDEVLLPEPLDDPPQDGFVVAYHGTITPHYGVPLIIDAVAMALDEIPDVAVRLYGDGDAVAEVNRRVAELRLGERVRVNPTFLAQAEVLREVQSASVGVIPNLPTRLNRYALSTKLFEYVALGVPVICSDLPTFREHFSAEEVLFFEPGSATDLASALVTTARYPDDARQRANAALERYQEYRWPRSAARYLDALHRCVARSCKSASRSTPPAP